MSLLKDIVDPLIYPIVVKLNKEKIKVCYCCSGIGESRIMKKPYISSKRHRIYSFPHIIIDKKNSELTNISRLKQELLNNKHSYLFDFDECKVKNEYIFRILFNKKLQTELYNKSHKESISRSLIMVDGEKIVFNCNKYYLKPTCENIKFRNNLYFKKKKWLNILEKVICEK